MSATAAHLTDFVLPNAPLRQWVLSVPFDIRYVLARDPEMLSAVSRIAIKSIFERYKNRAREYGIKQSQTGAIAFQQFFGGSLNFNPHIHIIAVDGVYSENSAGELEFHPMPPPTKEEIQEIVAKIYVRVQIALVAKGYCEASESVNASDAPIDACIQESLSLGDRASVGGNPSGRDSDDHFEKRESQYSAESYGFNLHAGTTVPENDAKGRERLCRYAARPPFSLARLSELPDGRLAYRLKQADLRGRTHLVMTPVAFLRRITALIPPPRTPLIRFYGVFGPNASYRERVVPKKPAAADGTEEKNEVPTVFGAAVIAWAALMARIFDIDVLVCPLPGCGGRLKIVAAIKDRMVVKKILDSAGLSTATSELAPARIEQPYLDLAFPGD